MKVALCLSGQIRSARASFDSIRRFILEPHNPDVFIDTWTSVDDGRNIKDDSTLHDVASMYNPVSIRAERYDAVLPVLKERFGHLLPMYPETVPINVASMHHKLHGCNEMKKQHEARCGFAYDVVIRCRPDLTLASVLEVGKSDDRTWNLPARGNYRGGIIDVFAWGSSKAMDVYSDLYNRMCEYAAKTEDKIHPERLVKQHAEERGFRVELFEFPVYIRGHYFNN